MAGSAAVALDGIALKSRPDDPEPRFVVAASCVALELAWPPRFCALHLPAARSFPRHCGLRCPHFSAPKLFDGLVYIGRAESATIADA
jgi:hypothetical protein